MGIGMDHLRCGEGLAGTSTHSAGDQTHTSQSARCVGHPAIVIRNNTSRIGRATFRPLRDLRPAEK
jgi:hypothetical protein